MSPSLSSLFFSVLSVLSVLLLLLSSSSLLVSSQSPSGYCFQYTFTGGGSAAAQWSVTASGVLSTSATLSNVLRNSATITSVTGSRTYTNGSISSTVQFTGLLTGTNATQVVYSQYPYTDPTGWAISTSGPVVGPYGTGISSLLLSQQYDPLLETSGSVTVYVGELKVITQSSVSSVSQCPTNVTLPVFNSLQPYSFCWYIQSDGTDGVSKAGAPWTTYAYGVFTASQTFEQEGRQAMVVDGITGLRYFAINGSTWWNRLVGMKDDVADLAQWGIKSDDILYTSDPYLDQYGWDVVADGNLTYPLGTSKSPDINFEFDQFGSAQYIDLNADNINYVQSSNQGFSYAPYQADGNGAHAACNSNNNTQVAFTPKTQQWTFCYVIYGADSTNGVWQLTSSGTITTYVQAVNVTSVAAGNTVVRSGYVAIGISGTRVWANQSVTVTNNILGLVPATELFENNAKFDNVVYTQYPYLDNQGLSFYLDGPVLPASFNAYGQLLSNATFVSIFSSGYNPLKELPTGGEEGSLIIRPASSTANLPAQCSAQVTGSAKEYSFCYSISGDKSSNDPAPNLSWIISAWGVLKVTGPFEREGQANTYRVTAATGQRSVSVTVNGVTTNTTQNILNVRTPNADTVQYGFLSNNILYADGLATVGVVPSSASMLLDEYGLIFMLDSAAVFPTNTTATGTVTSGGPDVNLCTDQFGTYQYYEESVSTSALIAQSATAALKVNSYNSGTVTSFGCPNTPSSYTPGSQFQSSGAGSVASGAAVASVLLGTVVAAALAWL